MNGFSREAFRAWWEVASHTYSENPNDAAFAAWATALDWAARQQRRLDDLASAPLEAEPVDESEELFALAHRCGLSTQLRLLAAADLQRANLTVDEALAAVNWTLLEFGKVVWERAQKETKND